MTTTDDRIDFAVVTLTAMFNDHDTSVVERRFSEGYIQHNPLIPNGSEPVSGFVASLADAPQVTEPKRAVAEGDFAAVHSRYIWAPDFGLDGGPGSAVVDIFRFGEDGRIVEHWDVAQKVETETASGNDMVSGGGDGKAPVNDEQVAANKQAVARLFDAFRSGDTGAFATLISDDYVQHNPQVANGLQAVQDYFGSFGPVDVELVRLIASGDLVFAHAHYKSLGTAAVDIFRFDDNGKIVEHWDVHQPVPETTASGNDMFSRLSR